MRIILIIISSIFLFSCVHTQNAALYQKPKTSGDYRILKSVQPKYPEWAKLRLIQGKVGLGYTVSIDGRAKDIYVIEEYPKGVFTQSAMDAQCIHISAFV